MTEQRKPARIGVDDIIGVTGVGLASYGTWLIYPPAAFILAGVLFMAVALLAARR